MKLYRPERVFLEREVVDSPITRNVLSALPGIPVELVDSSLPLLKESQRRNPKLAQAKKSLILARHQPLNRFNVVLRVEPVPTRRPIRLR